MFRAIWNGAILAESGRTVQVEGNQYFPADSLNREFFTGSRKATTCPWKGQASYYDVTVGGKVNRDAAWYYPQPSPAARKIAGHVAFWHGVRVEHLPDPAAQEPRQTEAGTSRGRGFRVFRWRAQAAMRP